MADEKPAKKVQKAPKEQTKEERLAEALRANLRRRKAAAKSDKT